MQIMTRPTNWLEGRMEVTMSGFTIVLQHCMFLCAFFSSFTFSLRCRVSFIPPLV